MSKKAEHTFCFRITTKGSEILKFVRSQPGILPNEILLLSWMEDGNYHAMGNLEKKTEGKFYTPDFASCILQLIKQKAIEELK